MRDTVLLQCPVMPRWLPICPTGWQHCCSGNWHSLPTWLSTSCNRAGAKCADGQRAPYARAGEDRLTFKALKSKAREHSQCGSPVPPRRGGWVCWGAAAKLHSQGAPRLRPAPSTNQLDRAQGETTLEPHFAFLKLPTLGVTCVSFALRFPGRAAQAPSISAVCPRQESGLEQCCEGASEELLTGARVCMHGPDRPRSLTVMGTSGLSPSPALARRCFPNALSSILRRGSSKATTWK